jgi:hydrogenase maturation protease
MSTIIIGLGNPILSDDSLGMHAVRELSARLQGREDVVVCELYSGGLDLMEAMVGYDRAVIIDAAHTGQMEPGTVFPTSPAGLMQSRNVCSNHSASIEIALELGLAAGLPLPHDIRIWAVEADNVETFGECLTHLVQQALPLLISNVLHDIDCKTTTFPENVS